MAEAEPGTPGGYVAFISYSHKDAAMGRWLHRRLEGYRLPRRLAGTQGEDGEVPARLTPIFRDRDELPAAGDLSERVRAALAASRNLVVLCSPHSAASPWVAKEIATFRELHPGRPIFTAVVEGDPGQCFSPALLEGGVEPLAADLRKAGDGRRFGLLKLVAGLAGVGLDALVQRDAARRIQRVTYITAAAVIAMIAMALLTGFALNARADAERQRAEAEGLIEFMLTDLRSKLKGVGRIDIMSAVNERAIAYYGDPAALRSLSDESLGRRARVLHARGEDDEKLGNLDAALGWFREAHSATAASLSRHPRDARAIFAHGQSDYWIGHVHELRQEWPQAAQYYRRYADAARRLISLDPGNPDYMMEMGWGGINIGLVELRANKRPDEALAYFRQAVGWFLKASRARPGDAAILRELSNAYSYVAEAQYMKKAWPEARAAYTRQYRVTQHLHSLDAEDTDAVYRLAIAERALARIADKLADRSQSRELNRRAAERMRSLTARDPANAEWLLMKAKIDCDLLKGASPAERRALRTDLDSARQSLLRSRNPRMKEVAGCLAH